MPICGFTLLCSSKWRLHQWKKCATKFIMTCFFVMHDISKQCDNMNTSSSRPSPKKAPVKHCYYQSFCLKLLLLWLVEMSHTACKELEKWAFCGNLNLLTPKYVNIDWDSFTQAWWAWVCSRVWRNSMLNNKKTRSDVTFFGDHTHATPRRVIRKNLKQNKNR